MLPVKVEFGTENICRQNLSFPLMEVNTYLKKEKHNVFMWHCQNVNTHMIMF